MKPNEDYKGREEGLREAWEILVKVSQNGGNLSEGIQLVHWRMKEMVGVE